MTLRKNSIFRDGRYVPIGQKQAIAEVHKAISLGLLVDLSVTIVKCSDCDERATQWDHRDYSRPLDVEPVCRSCNRRRGSAANNDQPDSNGLEFQSGRNYSGLNGGQKKKSSGVESGGGATPDFYDEHWVTYDRDYGAWKAIQEAAVAASPKNAKHFYMSFQRGLFNWYGVEPL